MAETAEVDALDEKAIDKHADAVAAKAGGIDIALNAVGILHVQGTPFVELSFQDYADPITAYTNAFPHGEGCRAAYGEARLGRDPHAAFRHVS